MLYSTMRSNQGSLVVAICLPRHRKMIHIDTAYVMQEEAL